MADSWKEQLLLNIVKTRYADAPAFMEVVSVVSGYSLEQGVAINGQFSPESMRGDTFAAAGYAAKFTDRPTISYAPLTGEKFARSLMAPVPLDSLMFTLQGGVPAEFLLGLTLQSFEGYHNATVMGFHYDPADPGFSRLLHLVGDLQQANLLNIEIISNVNSNRNGFEIWLQFEPPDRANTIQLAEVAEVKVLLSVPSVVNRVSVVFGKRAAQSGVVGMRTRSLLQIMATLGEGVEIPPEHLADGSVGPGIATPLQVGFKVRSGKKKPDAAFVVVPYDGLWFWIDRQDFVSKSVLATVTLLFNFLGSENSAAPVLTIPTN